MFQILQSTPINICGICSEPRIIFRGWNTRISRIWQIILLWGPPLRHLFPHPGPSGGASLPHRRWWMVGQVIHVSRGLHRCRHYPFPIPSPLTSPSSAHHWPHPSSTPRSEATHIPHFFFTIDLTSAFFSAPSTSHRQPRLSCHPYLHCPWAARPSLCYAASSLVRTLPAAQISNTLPRSSSVVHIGPHRWTSCTPPIQVSIIAFGALFASHRALLCTTPYRPTLPSRTPKRADLQVARCNTLIFIRI
jgi:hypothetical protein